MIYSLLLLAVILIIFRTCILSISVFAINGCSCSEHKRSPDITIKMNNFLIIVVMFIELIACP